MKRYCVISDIHGDAEKAEQIEGILRFQEIDEILFLGDILYHGPRNDLPKGYAPKKVIQMMNQFRTHLIAVRGNCDTEVDQMVLDFPLLRDSNILFVGERKVFMHHGHLFDETKLSFLNKGDIVLSGHTHIPVVKKENGLFFLNPGSLSLPKEGHPCTYGVLSEESFTIYTLSHEEYMKISFDKAS